MTKIITMKCQICGNNEFFEKEDFIQKSTPFKKKIFVCTKCGNEIHIDDFEPTKI